MQINIIEFKSIAPIPNFRNRTRNIVRKPSVKLHSLFLDFTGTYFEV